jgi:hypothetical protein
MALLEICLADQNPVVNYLSYNLFKPDLIIWLIPENIDYHLEKIQEKMLPDQETRFLTKNIPENDLPGIINICKKIKEEYDDCEIQLNLTGGKKVQSLIIANFFRDYAKKIYFIDARHSRIYDILGGETTNYFFDLTVNEYFELQGIVMESGLRFDPEIGSRSTLSYFIGNNIYYVSPFIDRVREEIKTKQKQQNSYTWELKNKEVQMAIEYESQAGKIAVRYFFNDNANTLEMEEEKAIEYLLHGGWLRELTFLRIHKGTNSDSRLNIKINRDSYPQGEFLESILDIASIKGSCLYLFQCFAFPIDRNSYLELKALRNTKNLLHADAFIMLAHKPNKSFIDQAHSDGIKIVYGKRISKFNF